MRGAVVRTSLSDLWFRNVSGEGEIKATLTDDPLEPGKRAQRWESRIASDVRSVETDLWWFLLG